MPIQPQLKIVASQLRNAAQERQRETDEMRRNLTIKEQQVRNELSSIDQEIQTISSLLLGGDLSDEHRIDRAQRVAELRREKSELERQLADEQKNVNQQMNQKSQEVNQLNSEAGSFEERAGQAD